MNRKQRDQAYWNDAYRAFFINGNYGKYVDVLQMFKDQYPEYLEHLKRSGEDNVDLEMQKTVRSIAKSFRYADTEEKAAAPKPNQLRQACLPFHIDVPPMSQSVNAFDGQGRLGYMDASPKQQIRHTVQFKQHHREGFVYREANEQAQRTFLEDVVTVLSDVALVGDLPMRQIVELLKQRAQTQERDEDTTTNPAPPPL